MALFTILAKVGWLVYQNSRRYQTNETMNLKTHLVSPRNSIAGDFETLPHAFLPHYIRLGLTCIKNGEHVHWLLTRGFVREETIQKISLYLGNGRPHEFIYS